MTVKKYKALPLIKEKAIIDPNLLESAQAAFELEKLVTVHCKHVSPEPWSMIRIWQSTFLRDHGSSHRSRMVTAHGITLYPQWMQLNGRATSRFTLTFSPLPKSCEYFDLFEDIPEAGGFFSGKIRRNKEDVYHVRLFT